MPETAGQSRKQGILTVQYLLSYHCIGGSCEDTCCSEWLVPLSRHDYERLKTKFESQPEKMQLFEQGVSIRETSEAEDFQYACVNKRDDGFCKLLTSEKKCALQQEFDESFLPDICSLYPKKQRKIDDRIEVAGYLSCPEIARLCLFGIKSTEIVFGPLELLPRMKVQEQVSSEEFGFYSRMLDEIRVVFLSLLDHPAYSLPQRMFFLLLFANEIKHFFFKGNNCEGEPLIAEAVEKFRSETFLRESAAAFDSIEMTAEPMLHIVFKLLMERLREHVTPKFHEFLMDVFFSLQGRLDSIRYENAEQREETDRRDDLIGPDYYFSEYEARRSFWESRTDAGMASGVFDEAMKNYVRSYIFSESFTFNDDLLQYLMECFVRYAVIRFLYYSSPELQDLRKAVLLGRELPVAKIEAASKSVLTKAVYLFSRNFEHSKKITTRLRESLEQSGFKDISSQLIFLKG